MIKLAPDSEISVITEEMRSMLGVEVGPQAHEIEKGMIKKFAEAIDDPNPLWQDEAYAENARYGSIVAPPGFLFVTELMEQPLWAMSVKCPLKGFVNAGNDFEYFQPIKPGDVISVTGKLVDLQEKQGKTGKIAIMIMERTYTNQRGETVAKARYTLIRM